MADGEDTTSSSILTPAQRNWLREGPELSPGNQAKRSMRARIRERIVAAVMTDFPLLFDTLPERDRQLVFKKMGFDLDTPRRPSMFGGEQYHHPPSEVIQAFAFLLSPLQNEEEVAYAVGYALKAIADREGVYRNINVDVEVHEPDPIDTGIDELQKQLAAGEIEWSDIEEHLRTRRIDPDVYLDLKERAKRGNLPPGSAFTESDEE